MSEGEVVKVVEDGGQRYIVCFPHDYDKAQTSAKQPPEGTHEPRPAAGDLVEALKGALIDSGKPPETALAGGIILDLSGTEYMNSSGLGAIFSLRKFAKSNHARMVIAGATAMISRLLETVNVPALIPVVPNLVEARKVLGELNEAIAEMEDLESSAKDARSRHVQ